MKNSRMKILIIDDDASDNFITRRVLERHQNVTEIVEVHSASAMLELAHQSKMPIADFILLDIGMPFMSGFALLEILIEKYGPGFVGTRLSVLSSSENPSDREHAKAHPSIDHFFLKPLSEQDAKEFLAA